MLRHFGGWCPVRLMTMDATLVNTFARSGETDAITARHFLHAGSGDPEADVVDVTVVVVEGDGLRCRLRAARLAIRSPCKRFRTLAGWRSCGKMTLRQVGVHQNTATRFGKLTGAEGTS